MGKKILIVANHIITLALFRKELIHRLVDEGYSVALSYPASSGEQPFTHCRIIDTPVNRRRAGIMQDIKLFFNYISILRKEQPDVTLTFTVKPNIYASLGCRLLKIPCINNITGLGIIANKGLLQKLLFVLQRISLKKSSCVFFQNKDDFSLYLENKIVSEQGRLIPGSGVNLAEYSPLPYEDGETVNFLFVSRILKEKGIDIFLDAAERIKTEFPHTRFSIIGFCEREYDRTRLDMLHKAMIVEYHGMQSDVKAFYGKAHCIVHPTYYPEGMSNVLLEAAACARPIISTDRSGCREVIDDGVNGYVVRQKDSEDLTVKIRRFIALSREEQCEMGQAGRRKVESEFDRQIVVGEYINEIARVSTK